MCILTWFICLSAVAKVYHLYMRITNHAKRDIRVLRKAGNEKAPQEFTVHSNAIVMVDIKVIEITYSVKRYCSLLRFGTDAG